MWEELVEVPVLEVASVKIFNSNLRIASHHVGGVPGGLGFPVVDDGSSSVWPLALSPPVVESPGQRSPQ